MADNYTDATDTDFKAENYNIDEGKKLSAEGMRAALHTKEKVANKIDVINSGNNSSSAQYPSVKAVYTLDGGGVPYSLSTVPSYYVVIYIMKIA
ncbi:MAG: hypothetical protein LBJ25_00595 [Candidatus Margulisbacteria bacterium]|jgi:hypothetical protein|nr:hypothetical protein [Candidatus Margulisiibacteriota bacterium]